MIRRRLFADQTGAAAVEFAIVMPVALLMIFGAVAIGISIWHADLLKSVATEAARCLAISGPACTTAAPACGDTPANCFTIALARQRGFGNLTKSNISIDFNSSSGGVVSTGVTLTYNYSLLGYPMSLKQQATFPNF